MKFRVVWVGVLAVLVLAGCTSSGEGASSGSGGEVLSPEAVAERYGYVEDAADLTPVYELVPNFRDERADVAIDLVLRECMIDVVELPVSRSREDPQFFEPRTGQPRESEELAAQWGYALHYPDLVLPEDPLNSEAARAHREEVLATEEGQARLSACREEVRERLPEPPERFVNDIESAGWTAADADPAVATAAQAWQVCMEPAGVIDLPEDPMLMPSASVLQAMGIDGAFQAEALPPTSQWEKDLAVADFRCQESSGWRQARWHARVQGELTAIGQDIEGFEAARLAYAEWGTALDSVMAELG